MIDTPANKRNRGSVMRLFLQSKPSAIIWPSEEELEELEENERLRKLAVTLKEKVDVLRTQ
jgi:hypothetical protein